MAMARKIDWMYHRKGCVSCKRAQGFLESSGLEADSITDARKDRKGPDEALKLARHADRIVVAKGKKVVTFDMKKDAPDNDTLLAHLIGPTGNLRAPTLRLGKTLLVGFSDEAYQQMLS
jgi:arsenate reductase-like glutaredoxin family protein